MKTRTLLGLALCIIVTAFLSGCGKTDANLQSENADLKARVQQLEQQLQASSGKAAAPSASASNQDLQGQLAEAQKKADAADDELKSLQGQVDSLKQKVDDLTRQLTASQQARQNAENALQLYKDKASSALRQFQALQKSLGGQPPEFDAYHQKYIAAQAIINSSLTALPESTVRRQIASVRAQFVRLDNIWETANQQIQARTAEAQAQYDKFIQFGGLGPNRYVLQIGKDKILGPAEQANAAAISSRNQQMVSSAKDVGEGIEKLQALLNGQQA